MGPYGPQPGTGPQPNSIRDTRIIAKAEGPCRRAHVATQYESELLQYWHMRIEIGTLWISGQWLIRAPTKGLIGEKFPNLFGI